MVAIWLGWGGVAEEERERSEEKDQQKYNQLNFML